MVNLFFAAFFVAAPIHAEYLSVKMFDAAHERAPLATSVRWDVPFVIKKYSYPDLVSLAKSVCDYDEGNGWQLRRGVPDGPTMLGATLFVSPAILFDAVEVSAAYTKRTEASAKKRAPRFQLSTETELRPLYLSSHDLAGKAPLEIRVYDNVLRTKDGPRPVSPELADMLDQTFQHELVHAQIEQCKVKRLQQTLESLESKVEAKSSLVELRSALWSDVYSQLLAIVTAARDAQALLDQAQPRYYEKRIGEHPWRDGPLEGVTDSPKFHCLPETGKGGTTAMIEEVIADVKALAKGTDAGAFLDGCAFETPYVPRHSTIVNLSLDSF